MKKFLLSMDYNIAIKRLRDVALSPGELSELKAWMAAEYAFLAGQMADILSLKPQEWARLREKATSDSQAEKAWELMPEGKFELSARYRMKGLTAMMSAINTRIRILEGESKAQF